MTGSCEVIEALEREWRDALCRKDMEQLGDMVHPDFVLIGTRSTGPFIMHRDQWLEAIQTRDVENIEFRVGEVTVLDDVMIGTVHARWKLKYLGRVIEDCVLSTDVWVRKATAGCRSAAIRRRAPGNQTSRSKGK